MQCYSDGSKTLASVARTTLHNAAQYRNSYIHSVLDVIKVSDMVLNRKHEKVNFLPAQSVQHSSDCTEACSEPSLG